MTAELPRRKEIFPRLKKLVPSLLHLPGDIMRLVSPASSNLGEHLLWMGHCLSQVEMHP